MSDDGGRQVCERVEVLDLTGPHDRQQTFDGALTFVASRTKHDLAPLDGRSERSLGGIVRALDALLVHEGKEVSAFAASRHRWPRAKSRFSIGQHFGDEFRTGERGASGGWIAAEAMPEAKEAAVEREGLAAEAFRGLRGSEVERTEQVPGERGPRKIVVGRRPER
jgi:hypothetical protein